MTSETSLTSDSRTPPKQGFAMAKPMEFAVKIGVLGLWATWCFRILYPFAVPLVWGVVIAVAIYPLYAWLLPRFGNRPRVTAVFVTLGMLVLFGGPVGYLGATLVENVHALHEDMSDGTITVPPPPPEVERWPFVGERLARLWTLASVRLDLALGQLGPEITAAGEWILSTVTHLGVDTVQFLAAVLMAGVLLVHAKGGRRVAHGIARRLAGAERGDHLANLAEATVRGVARGIIGVAVIEALLAGLGLAVAGVPLPGLWTLLCVILCLVQIGTLPVMIPAVIWVFATGDTTTGIALTVWTAVVATLENVVKPFLMGRGLAVPMPVVFLGAIGGMMRSGIVGLFTGAVILGLGHALLKGWLEAGVPPDEPESEVG